MKRLVLMCLLLVLPAVTLAGGTVEDRTFYSESLGFDRTMRVYLPEGYDPVGTQEYPVVYFLHGSIYGYEIYWYFFQMQAILDSLIASGTIQPIIFVTPDGLIGPFSGSYWSNSELYGNFEDYAVYDLVEFIDNEYRTIPTRSFRSVMGLSMGGYGAAKLGLKHPDVYSALAAHAGPIALDAVVEGQRAALLAEYSGPPYDYYPEAGRFSGVFFSRSGGFSPNMDNPPYFVDFPLDAQGEIVAEVVDRWEAHDPVYLASQIDPSNAPAIYFDCGTNDEYLAYPVNVAFAEALDGLGIAYEFQTFEGGHSDLFHTRLPIGLTFLSNALRQEVALDIMPGCCPNVVDLDESGNIKMAIVGSGELDAREIDTSSLLLEGTLAPREVKFKDCATYSPSEDCECPGGDEDDCGDDDDEEGDGIEDIRLKFKTNDVLALLGDVHFGEEYQLTITGNLLNGGPIVGADCIVFVGDDEDDDFAGFNPELADQGSQSLQFAQPVQFQNNVRLSYRIPTEASVSLAVYDLTGRLVEQLVDQTQVPGEYQATWKATDSASGIYFCRLQAGAATETRRIVLLPAGR